MKSEYIRIRTTPRRLNKLKLFAETKEQSMTRLIEDWIDSLPEIKNVRSSSLREASPTTNDPD